MPGKHHQEARPAETGQRLALARRSRGLSQEDAARHLSVSRPAVVPMDKGTRPARPAESVARAELYGCGVHDIVGRREMLPAFVPQFRVTQASEVPPAAVEAAVGEFQRICEDYLTLEELLGARLPQ